jgi:transposase InsO family protein
VKELSSEYPVSRICRVLNYARSSCYYQPTDRDERKLREVIEQIAAEWPKYGYRRVTAQLRRQGWLVNSKRVRRMMAEMGLQAKIKRRKRRTTNSEHDYGRYPNLLHELLIVKPDQVWAADITYVRLKSEFVYLAVIMDVYTRCIRGWHLSRSLDQELTLTALQKALNIAVPEIHHSDQGVQYAADKYVKVLKQASVAMSMAEVGEAWQNGYAERLIRTIKEEEIDLSDYHDFWDAYAQIGNFIEEVYMHKRIHSSLGYLTPIEFEQIWFAEQSEEEFVH